MLPMQLRTLVLPAPLGPISAISSAASTASETRSRTSSPPKARLRSVISSSAIPSPIATVLLDGAIAAALAGARLPQIELAHVRMIGEAPGAAVEHDAAVFQNVTVVDHAQAEGRILLHDQQGQSQRAADPNQALQNVLDHHGRKAERELVDQQQFGLANEAGGDGQHLPLAPRQQTGGALAEIAEPWGKLEELRLAAAPLRTADAGRQPHPENFRHRPGPGKPAPVPQ